MGREKFPLLGSGPGRLGSSPLLRKLPSAAAWRCVLVGMARGHLPGLSLLPSHLANSCSRSVLSQGSGGTGSLSRGASSSFEVAPGWGAGSCREKLAGVAAVGAGLLVGRPPAPTPGRVQFSLNLVGCCPTKLTFKGWWVAVTLCIPGLSTCCLQEAGLDGGALCQLRQLRWQQLA